MTLRRVTGCEWQTRSVSVVVRSQNRFGAYRQVCISHGYTHLGTYTKMEAGEHGNGPVSVGLKPRVVTPEHVTAAQVPQLFVIFALTPGALEGWST